MKRHLQDHQTHRMFILNCANRGDTLYTVKNTQYTVQDTVHSTQYIVNCIEWESERVREWELVLKTLKIHFGNFDSNFKFKKNDL